jgi:hypothetical protein
LDEPGQERQVALDLARKKDPETDHGSERCGQAQEVFDGSLSKGSGFFLAAHALGKYNKDFLCSNIFFRREGRSLLAGEGLEVGLDIEL